MFPSSAPEAAPMPSEQAKPGNRKALLAVGGVVAALVVGAGAFFALSSSGGSDDPVAAPAKGNPTAAASPTPSPTAKATTTIKTVTVAARDPFAVLFPPTPTPTAKSTAPSGSTTQVQTTTSTPALVTPKVTLAVSGISTAKQTATVTVDGVKYSVAVGKVFGSKFVMYSVFNGSCVGLLYGDQNVAVCVAKPVSV
jgi:hypothetical protein